MLVLVRASVFAEGKETQNQKLQISMLLDGEEHEEDSLDNSSLTSLQPVQINDVSFPLLEVRIALPDRDRDPQRDWSRRGSS